MPSDLKQTLVFESHFPNANETTTAPSCVFHTVDVLVEAEQLLSDVLTQFLGFWVLDLGWVAGADEDVTHVLTEAVNALMVDF